MINEQLSMINKQLSMRNWSAKRQTATVEKPGARDA